MSSNASLRASGVRARPRDGVGQRSRITKSAVQAIFLLVRAGAVVTVLFHWAGRDSAEAREALMVPLAVFWTFVAVMLIWTIDLFVRALRWHVNKRSAPARGNRGSSARHPV